MHPKAWIVAGLAAAALGGIALAADAQHETFLHSGDLGSGFRDIDQVSGNLVALTGILVAASITAAAGVLARVGWKSRILPLAVMFVSSYVLVLIVQTGMFNYVAEDQTLSASFSISPLILNLPAAPSVFMAPIALAIGAGITMAGAGRVLLGADDRLADAGDAFHTSAGAAAIVAPFLVIAVTGDLAVILTLPGGEPNALPYLVLMPLAILASATLLVTLCLKLVQLAQAAQEPRLSPVAEEAWGAVRRIEWAAVATIAGIAVLGSFLQPIQMPVLEAGRVFGLTTRSHLQSHLVLIFLLIPWWIRHQDVMRCLANPDLARGGMLWRAYLFIAVVAVGGVATVVLGLLVAGALWPWLIISAVLALYGLTVLRRSQGLMPAMLCALVLWAIGNTVVGNVELASNFQIGYDKPNGLLALGRALAVLLVAWAVSRAARPHAQDMRRSIAWPITAGLGALVALILFMELQFSAWIIREAGSEAVGIGTVVASQDTPVRVAMHAMSAVSAFVAGLAVARLHRPDWFGKGSDPVAAETPLPRMPEHSAE